MKSEYNENIGSNQLTNATGTDSLGQEAASVEVNGSEAHSRAGERVVPGGNSSRMISGEGRSGTHSLHSTPQDQGDCEEPKASACGFGL